MQLHPLKQVTIIVEKILQDQLLPKLIELGANGYTTIDCSGSGVRGVRSGEFGSNVQITLICPEDISHKILTFVSRTYFDNYACIAWESDVQVVRGAHYVK
ncbi:MAG: nitrogen regulatory protein [Planctomycetaceae bacterium]|nr:nitrogen regulatory protein [Planctomycetaceae bacterium]